MRISIISRFTIFAVVATVFFRDAVRADEPATKVDPESSFSRTFYLRDRTLRVQLSDGVEMFGLETVPVEEVLRVQLGLDAGKGLVVTKVDGDGSAAKAGLRVNDVLVSVGEKNVTDVQTLRKQLQESIDKSFKVAVLRAGMPQTVEWMPKASTAAELLTGAALQLDAARFWLGVGLASADVTLRSQLNLGESEGLVVTSVENESPAFKSGVLVNDVLLKLDGKTLTTIEDMTTNLQAIGDKSVGLDLLRRGKPARLTVTPEKRTMENMTVELMFGSAQSVYFDIGQHPLGLWSSQSQDISRLGNGLILTQPAGIGLVDVQNNPPAKPNLADQVNHLLEQTKQLQISLDALKVAIEKSATTPVQDSKPAKP